MIVQPRVENAVPTFCFGEKRIPLCGWSQVAILQVLCAAYPKTAPTEAIMNALWGSHGKLPSDPRNTLSVQMCNLRRRIGQYGAMIERYDRGHYKLTLATEVIT